LAYEILPSKHVIKYLKKLKEKTLKEQFLTIIYDEIAVRPHSGEQKTGDLSGIWAIGFKYAGKNPMFQLERIDDTLKDNF